MGDAQDCASSKQDADRAARLRQELTKQRVEAQRRRKAAQQPREVSRWGRNLTLSRNVESYCGKGAFK